MRKAEKFAFLVTLIIAFALVVVPFGALRVSAAEITDTQVTAMANASVMQGETGVCYVYIDSLEGLSSLIVTVHYDPSKVHVTEGSVVNAAPSLLYDKAIQSGSVQFSYIFDGNGNAAKTQLFSFAYTVLSTAASGETYFDIVVSEAYDSALRAMPIVGSRCVFSIVSNSSVVSHSYRRQVIEDRYKKSDATCTSPAVYYYCCETCNAKGDITFEYGWALGHMGGVATCTAPAVCIRCLQPYGDTLDHVYTDEDANDAYLVWEATCMSRAVYYKNCATCDKAGSATFEYGWPKEHAYTRQVITDIYKVLDATCVSAAKYAYCCATCDAAGTSSFSYGNALGHTGGVATCMTQAECTRCHQIYSSMLEHVYTNEDATEAYLKSEATCTDRAVYYKNCVTCGIAGPATFESGDKKEHTYTNACDTDCNTCGYIRTISHNYNTKWSKDAAKHWLACSVCGDKKNEAAHKPGADATETADQVCTVCAYVIQVALGHTHNYNMVKNDDTNHWNECKCGDKTGVSAHIWDSGVVTKDATYDEEGEKTFTCVACSHTKVERIEKLARVEDTSTGKDVDAETIVDSDVCSDDIIDTTEEDESPLEYGSVILAVFVVGVLVTIFIIAMSFARIKNRTRR